LHRKPVGDDAERAGKGDGDRVHRADPLHPPIDTVVEVHVRPRLGPRNVDGIEHPCRRVEHLGSRGIRTAERVGAPLQAE
jgi:hypothetical protein